MGFAPVRFPCAKNYEPRRNKTDSPPFDTSKNVVFGLGTLAGVCLGWVLIDLSYIFLLGMDVHIINYSAGMLVGVVMLSLIFHVWCSGSTSPNKHRRPVIYLAEMWWEQVNGNYMRSSSVRLFVCSSVRLFVCSSVRLFVCSSVRLFVCSSVCAISKSSCRCSHAHAARGLSDADADGRILRADRDSILVRSFLWARTTGARLEYAFRVFIGSDSVSDVSQGVQIHRIDFFQAPRTSHHIRVFNRTSRPPLLQ
jgi:hypothetical protein